jgi:capsular polysaccharide transport system permease protein
MVTLDFAEGLRSQGRVLLALMLREARTRYGRHKLGYFWALVEPMMHIAIFYFVFSYSFRVVPLGHGLLIFLVTGLGTYLGFQRIMDRTLGGYASNEALLSFPVVKVFDVFLGRALLEFATWIPVTLILIGGLIAVGAAPNPRSILVMMAAMVALFAMAVGCGMCLGIVAEFLPSLETLLRIPFRLLYFTSGGFFLPEALPPGARDIVVWNPVLHGITLFRSGDYPRYDSHTLDLSYLVSWSVGCLLAGFVLVRVAAKSLRNRR